jgi:WD40 repeat protein
MWPSRFGILIALAVLVFSVPENIEGQISSLGMQQMWTTHVAQLVKEPTGWTEIEHHETIALAFSPDDQRLAVTISHDEFASGWEVHSNTHLLVIDVQSPESNVHRFDLSETCGTDLAWNESGNALLVCGTLLRLSDGTRCEAVVRSTIRRVSGFKAFWWDSEHVIRSNTGEILDLTCKPTGTWQLERFWHIGAVAPTKGWVLQSHIKGASSNVECET